MTRSAPARSLTLVSRDGDLVTHAGTRIPRADLRARQIARQAGRWRTHAGDRSRMRPETLDAKALDACAFSVHHGAASFAVPSKLVGTSRHQPALRALPAGWVALDLDARGDRLVVSHGGRPLGQVQPKHVAWVRPLVAFGLRVYLARVTGGTEAGYRLGCNVAFGHVGAALAGLAGAAIPLGTTARSAQPASASGGDGAPAARSPLRLVVPQPGGTCDARVPVCPEHQALTGDPGDVVLWRTPQGEARASVPHVPRHSPTGIEWGYRGSGPADLARSVLLALADEPTADALYHRFKAEVVAAVPETGGVLRAADVRAWVARHDA